MIRIMKIEDYEQAYALWSGTAGMGLRSLDDSREGIEKFLKRNPTTCFVSEEDGRITGTILCGHDGRRGSIYHTAVVQEFRKHGIGKGLVQAALSALRDEGIHKAALVVFGANETGNAFWMLQGWERREDLNYYSKSINEANQ